MNIELGAGVDLETQIWRYVKLNGFLEMLSGRLALTRADRFDDPSEGWHVDQEHISFAENIYERLSLSKTRRAEMVGYSVEVSRRPHEVIYRARRRAFITCWMERTIESYAMWRIYGRLHESVAIASTVGKLKSVLEREHDGMFVEGMIGKVSYARAAGEMANVASLFFNKRQEFENEREIRGVLVADRNVTWGSVVHPVLLEAVSEPIYFAPKLEDFIDAIIMAPGSRDSFREAVERAVSYVVGSPLRIPVTKSSLDEDVLPIPIDHD